jgi:hypothetical protein
MAKMTRLVGPDWTLSTSDYSKTLGAGTERPIWRTRVGHAIVVIEGSRGILASRRVGW